MLRLSHAVFPEEDQIILTPEGTLKLVSVSFLAFISILAPDKIVYYSELTPNPKEIRSEIAKYMDPLYISELIPVRRLKRYQLPGTMIRCLEVMKYDRDNPAWWGDPGHLKEKG